MHRETAHTSRRSRSLVIVLLALAIVTVFGIAASQALAIQSYEHGGAVCANCHGTPFTPTNAKCATCHTNFVAPIANQTCWTCHTPGQDMSGVATGAPATCLAAGCHATNNPHPERGTCTTSGCHSMSTSASNPNGSPHHNAAAVTPTITIKSASSVKVKKPIKIQGKVTPVTLAGKSVIITIQMKSGAIWKPAKLGSATIAAVTGNYVYTYKPTKKGTYQVQASMIAASGVNPGASPWKTFKVK
jgi:hypothetical protein